MRIIAFGGLVLCVACGAPHATGGIPTGSTVVANGSAAGASSGPPAGSTAGPGNTTILDAGFFVNAQPPPADPCIQAGTCPPGSWVNVTPSALSMDPDFGCTACNYGAQDVVVDPVRPEDLYAFICYQGVWKSTDYGLTWAKIDSGTNAHEIEAGRPWTAAIDPNVLRNPATPPALYTVSGYGDQMGVYKSTDGGVNWSYYAVNNTQGQTSSDVYALDIDPGNSNHLIAGFHDVGLSESTDGGQTWNTISVPSNFGISVYAWFVNTGSAATTSTTWLTMAQWDKNTNGMWRTTDSGGSWQQVEPMLEHGHGSSQIFQDGKGAIYASGNGGNAAAIFRSPDYGQTWQPVKGDIEPQNGVFGTPNYVYATLPGAFQSGDPQHLQRSKTADGLNWSDWNPTAPSGMTNGAKRAAVTFDGSHYIIVSGNWLAGLWRYVE